MDFLDLEQAFAKEIGARAAPGWTVQFVVSDGEVRYIRYHIYQGAVFLGRGPDLDMLITQINTPMKRIEK